MRERAQPVGALLREVRQTLDHRRPAPRSTRAANVSWISAQPVAAAIRAAARSAGSRRPTPPRNNAAGAPLVSAAAAASTRRSPTAWRARGFAGAAGPGQRSHAESCGTISVATWPGGSSAAAIASAPSAGRYDAVAQRRTQPETGEASDAMSDVRGASAARCQLA
jgi:hypothetical protein